MRATSLTAACTTPYVEEDDKGVFHPADALRLALGALQCGDDGIGFVTLDGGGNDLAVPLDVERFGYWIMPAPRLSAFGGAAGRSSVCPSGQL